MRLCASFACDEKHEPDTGESSTYTNLFKSAPATTTMDMEIPYYDCKAVTKNVPIR